MMRRQPSATRTYTLFPYTTRVRSARSVGCSDTTLARFSFHIAEAARRPRPASGAIECALLTLRDPPGGAVPAFGSLDTKPPQRQGKHQPIEIPGFVKQQASDLNDRLAGISDRNFEHRRD